VHDHIQVVHQDPFRLRQALDPARQDPVVVLHTDVHAIVDPLYLAIATPGGDHEVVGVGDHAPQVELDDVQRLAI
jgi:hypothetical protein